MSEQLSLTAETRDRAGKGASRELRNQGRVPAVVYGANQEPLSIHVEEKLLAKMLSTGHFMNSVVMIDAGGKTTRTLPKDVQFHPVSSRPVHVDFLRISEHSKVTVNVPVRFTDEEESPGIKRGAVLNIVKHEIEFSCDAAEIPDDIEISLKGLDVGDSIHISNVTLPTGVEATITDRDFTIATIVAPSSMKSDAGDAEEDAAEAATDAE
ncbi:50S ribosomal protein L25/general stress protein Ctc [Sphingomonas glaciei]|uniref:Large ribosomal subunit protein bL25 n=1 Tax=Sphingomonas glaciei TaxID=2938948 RepID=A0ABY5N1S4_9SPHN|nr:50S ribosomal protein L25/general stress protein Ctc [Sphingomonas glaciei]UUR09243.1 50S ribosomal protein L25/general stress protein Ctc [Sphingomonas glaciei]